MPDNTISADWVLVDGPQGQSLRRDHELVVEDGIIQEVRQRRDDVGAEHLPGQILIPGFVSGHGHAAPATATRGYIENNPKRLVDGRSQPRRAYFRTMRMIDDLSDADLDALTEANVLEMLRSGVTTHVEMSLSLKQMRSFVRVCQKYGIRAYPSAMVPGMRSLQSIWMRGRDDSALFAAESAMIGEIDEAVAFAREIDGDLLRPMLAVGATAAHTPETMRRIHEAAATLHGVHIHIQAGTPSDPADDQLVRLWGLSEVPWLAELGWLHSDVKVIGAHCLGIDLERDPALLATDNFTFVSCPSGTGAGVSPGFSPLPELLAAGVNTSIGVDTHATDFLEVVKLAVMFARARTDFLADGSTVPMVRPSVATALEAATVGGARGLGRSDLGRIRPGARADLTAIDVTGPLVGAGVTPPEPLNNLLYANGLAVQNVWTDGVRQVQGGRLIVADEAAVFSRAGRVVEQLWARLDGEDYFVDVPDEELFPPVA